MSNHIAANSFLQIDERGDAGNEAEKNSNADVSGMPGNEA